MKAKVNASATETSSKVVHDTMDKRVVAMEKLAHLMEEENILKKEEMEFKAMVCSKIETEFPVAYEAVPVGDKLRERRRNTTISIAKVIRR